MESADTFVKNLNDILTPARLLLLFLAVILAFIVISLILVYHWRSYAIKSRKMTMMIISYFAVSGILIVGMLLSLSYYTK